MSSTDRKAPQLPLGTQVVLRETLPDAEGAVAQRGATGRVVCCRREQVSLRRAYQRDVGIQLPDHPDDGASLVDDHTIYAAIVGSRAFGLATDESDTDVRGVYVAPTSSFWSLVKPPMHVEGPGEERFSWEVERFCELALRANPNLLEVLHSPLVVTRTPLGEELVDLRDAFLSQLAYQTYSGYVLSQFKKLEADLRNRGAPKWKHVMHLLRLLLSARDLAVRRGDVDWNDVEQWRLALHAELDDALRHTPLPAAPDVERVDAWLRSVRARNVDAVRTRS